MTPTPTAAPPRRAAARPPADAAAPAGADPRTVTYRVTGNRSSSTWSRSIYTDPQGALQTDFNVALPWTKTVVLNPGVQLSSVDRDQRGAVSSTARSPTRAGADSWRAQTNNTMIATCTR